MPAKQLSDRNVDGTSLGQDALDKISLYGATPVVQPAHTNQAAITAGATTTQCNNAVIAIQAALVAIGAMKGSA